MAGSTTPHARRLRVAGAADKKTAQGQGEMDSEQTTDQTFRVTSTPEGRIGVTVFVKGKPGVVLWRGSEDASAAERLALHLETQVDRVSSPAMARKELA